MLNAVTKDGTIETGSADLALLFRFAGFAGFAEAPWRAVDGAHPVALLGAVVGPGNGIPAGRLEAVAV
ncbi:hypothetical protein ACIBCM_18660 [Streptomyces sp. NPDC051018]|uniref:hypothetical protein n=1 Tax=Streptomyces sp. NPDC051018 TaxID=3365639 RepID=UPI0037A0AE34